MASLTHSLWRSVGRFAGIKGLGALECTARQCRQALNEDFWRSVWLRRCDGRLFKSKKRMYKVDVMVYFAKEVVRNMRFCSSVPRWYSSWHEAAAKRRALLRAENKNLAICIRSYLNQIESNKRKLSNITNVEEQAESVLTSISSYGEDATGPMLTQQRRIQEELKVTKQNPWLHYG